MNDQLEELSRMRADVPPPTQDSLRSMRTRMFNGRRPSRGQARPWVKVGIASGMALALTVGIVLFQGVLAPSGNGPQETRFGTPANAQEVLSEAAIAVREQQPQQRPRDDQFIYQKTLSRSESDGDHPGEEWQRFAQPPSKSDTDHRTPEMVWEYNESLPDNPEQIREELYAEVDRLYRDSDSDGPTNRHERALWLAATILGAGHGLPAPPEQRAALFDMMASIPGVKVEVDFEDIVGRKGIYVYRGKPGDRGGYIFATDTYDYLGRHTEDPGWTREEVRKLKNTPPEIAEELMKPNTLDEVLLERKVVDQRGDR